MTATPLHTMGWKGNLAPGDTMNVFVDGENVTGPIPITEAISCTEIAILKIEDELGYDEGLAVVFGRKGS